MIFLTKLDASAILVNTENIKYMEAVPDTLIHFINGDTLLVREKLSQIQEALLASKAYKGN